MRDYESASSLAISCPRLYWLKYNKGLAQVAGQHLRKGKAIHAAIKVAVEKIIAEVPDPITEGAFFKEFFAEALDPCDFMDLVRDTIEGLEKLPGLLEGRKVYNIEEKRELKRFAPDGRSLVVIPDILLVDGKTAICIDHKTSYKMEEDEEAQNQYQTLTNAALAFDTIPEVDTFNIRYTHWHYHGAYREGLWTREQFEAEGRPRLLVGFERTKYWHEKGNELPLSPGDNCRYCPGTTECLEQYPLEIPDNIDPVVAAEAWALYEAAAEKAKEVVKSEVEHKGPFLFSGGKVGFFSRKSKGLKLGSEETVSRLMQAGESPLDYMEFNAAGLKKLEKKNPEFVCEKESLYFGRKKAQE